jgi:catechol 2,3-dioxygenase-like lactoylglutathione lyase family enzyme
VANGRRPIPPLRAYTAAVLGVFALFVISAGAGMASWSIVVLGLALMILAVSLVVVSAMRGGTRAYVAGTAHVVSASEPPASSMYGRCELHLVVDAPGLTASAVKIRDPRVPVAKWPDAGTTLPIMVAVDDPRRVRVQWDDVPTHAETAAEEQFIGEYTEQFEEQQYARDYVDEYPEYVPPRDPMAMPPDAPDADRGRPAADDLTDLADLLDGPDLATEPTTGPPAPGAEPTAPAAPGAEPTTRPPAPAGEPTAAAGWHSPAAEQPTRRPPAPRRPEASPEAPEEEADRVGGEPLFAPNVPPGSQAADRADPKSGAGMDTAGAARGAASTPAAAAMPDAAPTPAAAPAAGDGGEPEPAVTPPRPRPRPRPRRSDEQASVSGQAATRHGAMATVVEATEEAPAAPSVTAIEFDLGELVTAYPSARPGTAGPISGVGITVPVTDLARSADFYRDVLGFYEIDGGAGSLVLASGNTRVVLREARDAPPGDRRQVHLNLEVADVQAVYEELTAKGVRFTHGPRPTSRGERLELWSAEFRDPDGHGIAISQWRNRANGEPDR